MKYAARVCAALLGAAVLLSPLPALAGPDMIDVIVMKDGTVIKGKILELNTRNVVVETPEGGKVTERFEDVLTFEKEPAAPEKAPAAAGTGKEERKPFFDRHTWEVGSELYTVTYKEPGLMEETGVLAGIRGAYTYHNGWMLKGEIRYAQGQVDYTSSGTGSVSDIDDAALEARALVGYDVALSETGAVTFFSGFGYRYLEDDSGGKRSTTGASGYRRESNYFYSPVGVASTTVLAEKWRISFLAEYDHFWKGRQESYLSDAVAGAGDVSNNQNSGYGLRASIGLAYAFGWGELCFRPFVRYWDIGESERTNVTYAGAIVGIGWEPANDTLETGLTVEARF